MILHPSPITLHNAKCKLVLGSSPEWVAAKFGLRLVDVYSIHREVKRNKGEQREASHA